MIEISACSKDSRFIFTIAGNTVDKVKSGGTVTVTCAEGYTPYGLSHTTAVCTVSGGVDFNDTSFTCVGKNGELNILLISDWQICVI